MEGSRIIEQTGPRAFAPALALAALGVVFGDIGTSPLYAFRQCFATALHLPPTHANVLGMLSLILWSLILIVFVRYISMIMRVSHDGEGGILALLAFVLPPVKRGVPPKATWLTFLIILGAGMLFGDGVITPAVSVLSAVEGLNVATSALQPFVIPITVGVLVGLFLFQNRGTSRIGAVFGPIMTLWFLTIAALGVWGIFRDPAVLHAIDPIYIVNFFAHHGIVAITIFGAIVLCVSGVEALYADMSHFGRQPIAIAWGFLVFPALVLNYLGQGALVLANPEAVVNPFFGLVPGVALYAVVGIATAATIIASQALISGVFTLAKQAIQLGFIPRVQVVYTNAVHRGQIYVPMLNLVLAVLCIGLVLWFHSSERLANAYGLAVAVTMVVTSIAYYVVVREKLGWSRAKALVFNVPFMVVELLFVLGSLPKIHQGGWIPILISLVVFAIAGTWRTGRRRVALSFMEQSVPVEQFLEEVKGNLGRPLHGTAVFLTSDPEGVPFVMRHHWARIHSVDERIVLMTVVPVNEPYVPEAQRVHVEKLAENLVRVTASYGFMEKLSIGRIVSACEVSGLKLDDPDTTYYVADPQIVAKKQGRWRAWRRNLFVYLKRNARPITASLGIPADELAKLGIEVGM
ncbi:MAG TPA: KUP/HAK/KT family potassium transporter [Candidatus Baltobacteraceae bacterium]|jgi:KUP system potassium uptake protein